MRVYPGTDSYFQWLTEHNVISTEGTLPIMVRCVNVKEALQNLPVSGEGELLLQVVDTQCPWNSARLKLREEHGSLHVEEVSENVTSQITLEGISAAIYGTMKVDELIDYEWIKGLTNTDLETLNQWFPLKYPWMAEQF
jgi:predicted acetyltransferase